MSESILKLIDKRSKTDVFIFIGMALLTLVLIYILLWYIKPMMFGAAVVETAVLSEVI